MITKFNVKDLEDAPPVSTLPAKTILDAYFDGTKCIIDFAKEVMLPQLKAIQRINPTEKEKAILETYFRMWFLLQSVVKLNTLEDFQSVAAATRSLFELWLDLKILTTDTTGKAVKDFNEFTEIERYRVAEQMLEFDKKNPKVLKRNTSLYQDFCNDAARKRRVMNLKQKTKKGKEKYPEHWTRKSIRKRAIDMSEEVLYVEAYPFLSWYIHAGATGTAGVSKQGLEGVFGMCHSVMQTVFVNATRVCAKETKITEGIEQFSAWMTEIRLKSGELIAIEQIKLLEERRKQLPIS